MHAGEVKDTRNWMLIQTLVGLRVAWWAVMTWIVVLMMGNGVAAAYINTFRYNLIYTMAYRQMPEVPRLPAGYVPVFPECPIQCINTWVIDFIMSPKQPSCFCDPAAMAGVSASKHLIVQVSPYMRVCEGGHPFCDMVAVACCLGRAMLQHVARFVTCARCTSCMLHPKHMALPVMPLLVGC